MIAVSRINEGVGSERSSRYLYISKSLHDTMAGGVPRVRQRALTMGRIGTLSWHNTCMAAQSRQIYLYSSLERQRGRQVAKVHTT